MITVSRVDLLNPAIRLEEGAFEAIFHEHYPKVYAILFRLTGDQYEADDLAAETFWRLWERPPAQRENLAGWLYRVATRLGYNALRSNRRRDQYETKAVSADPSDQPGQASSQDPALTAEQRQEREHVRAVLRRMPLREVQVLVLRHSGLSYKEIAAAEGIAAGSIGTLLSRAEARFEVLYKQGEEDASQR
jgi:RNA polymerase sigma-70 factor (ECF subfamily)